MAYTRVLYNPKSTEPFKISRSKIDLFIECPRCFYLDRRLGISRPGMPAFSLNNAVDNLLKTEFDYHRAKSIAHPIMTTYKIDAVPFNDPRMDEWRDSLRRGITYLHQPTNLIVSGGIDDVWEKPNHELIIVDYKATATDKEITLNDKWKQGYKRQMEVYQWLFRHNDFVVDSTGIFVFVNGRADKQAFDAKLEFDVQIIPYTGDDSWVEGKVMEIKQCLDSSDVPKSSENCEHCNYRNKIISVLEH
jgi:hypothetical protein